MSKTIKRNCIAVLVALFALVAIFGVTQGITTVSAASAQEDVRVYAEDGDDYEAYLGFVLINDGTEYKVRATDKTRTEMTIPSVHDGIPVTEIADNGFMSCRNLKTVYIPFSVGKIGGNGFYGCSALERVYGATAVETIGNSAFAGCTKLNYFCVYDSIATLGSNVFRNVQNDIYIRMTEDEFASKSGINANWAAGRASGSRIIYGTEQICEALDETNTDEGYKLIQAQECNVNVARAENPPYFYCSEEGDDGKLSPVKQIESYAFENWESEDLIVVYDNRLSETGFTVCLNDYAFAGMFNCVNLEIDVEIAFEKTENDEKILSESIFMSSPMLETVTMPDCVEVLPKNVFLDCISLTSLRYKNGASENVLSDKITHIDDYAFAQCYGMTEIHIPSSVKTMGMSVFQDWGSENYMTGETKQQKIVFDSYLPPESVDEYDTWDNGLGEAATVEYKTKTVTLDTRGGIGGAQTVEAMYGRPLPSVEAPKPEIEAAFVFGGYYSAPNSKGSQYYDGEMNCEKVWGKEEIEDDLSVLYAYWDKKDIPIALIINDDGDPNSEIKITVRYDECFERQSIAVPTKSGYEFQGFYSERNGGGIMFYDCDLNPSNVKYTDLGIDVLYAYWTPIRYQVSLLPGEGSGGTQSIYIPFGTTQMYLDKDATEPVAFISVPTREHYIFAGYFTKDGKQYFSAEEVNGVVMAKCVENWEIAFNDNLDARWQIIHYNFTYVGYMDDGSDYVESITIDDITASDKTYRREELKKVKEGIKRSWSAIMLASSELKDLIIYSTTSVATLSECYDSDTQTYTIWYPSQFDEMRNKADSRFGWITGNFELMTDIDLSSYKNWTPIPTLFGSFKGNSHTVSGMNIQVSASGNYGLFESNVGLISLLTVSGNITVASGVKDVNVGLLCGRNGGRIERCYTEKGSSYSIESNSYFAVIGGLTGYNRGVVYNVANRAGIYGKGNIGGIVGKNEGTADSSFISLASSQGEIYARSEGSESVGGIVAVMSGGRIESCTCTGKITVYGVYGNGSIAMPCVGQVIGTFYDNKNTSYGTQMVLNTIVKEGKPSGINIGGDIGKTIFQPDLGV